MKEKPKYSNTHILKTYIGFAKPYLGLLIFAMILNTIFTFFSTLSIALIKPAFELLFEESAKSSVDYNSLNGLEKVKFYLFEQLNYFIESDNKLDSLFAMGTLIVLVFLIKVIFKIFSTIANTKVEENIVKNIRDNLFEKVTSLGLDFFSRNKQGHILSAMTNDVQVFNQSNIKALIAITRDSVQVFLFLILLLSISSSLTITAFSISIGAFAILRFASKYLKKYSSRMQQNIAEFTVILQETIAGIKIIKAHSYIETSIKKFKNKTKSYVRSAIKLSFVNVSLQGINEIFAICALAAVLYVGGKEALIDQTISSSELMAYLFTLFAVMNPIATIVNEIANIQRGFVTGERLLDIFTLEPSVTDGKLLLEHNWKKIEVKNLSFKYSDNTVLSDISLTINRGESVAFVGQSGSGKSTLIDLLLRFYDPQNGTITVDGVNLKDIKLDSWLKQFGMVAQDNILFNDSVLNNIEFGSGSDFKLIKEAADISLSTPFIEKMQNGFETILGDRGLTVSGGERQRLAIARALARDPQVLVFDEATSALDSDSEKKVQEAIYSSLEGRTAIIVAHRLSTIINCNKICVFEKGNLVEMGTHSELLALKGTYFKLHQIQFGG